MTSSRALFAWIVTGLLLYLLWPVLVPVLMGGIFAILFFPAHSRLRRWRVSGSASAALLAVGIAVGIVLPLLVLVSLTARFGIQQFHSLRDSPASLDGNLIETILTWGPVARPLETLQSFFSFQLTDVAIAIEDLMKTIGLRAADRMGDLLAGVPSAVLGLLIMVISVYFFLQDGERIVGFVRGRSFFNADHTRRLLGSLAATCRSVVLAAVITGVAQAAVFALFCVFVGKANVLIIAFLIFIMSFIPLVGSAPITFGVAVHHFLTQGGAGGVALIVAAGLVAVMDNFIRPAVLKGTANLHPLLAFLAVFGGLQTMGFSGIFLGPILASLVVTTITILPRDPEPVAVSKS